MSCCNFKRSLRRVRLSALFAFASFSLSCLPLVLTSATPAGPSASLPWTARPLDNPAAVGSSVPRVTAGPSGKLYLSWMEPFHDGQAFRFSVWNGDHWDSPKTIAAGSEVLAATSSEPGVLELPKGLLAAQWLTKAKEKEANHIVVAISRDRGATWSTAVKPYRDATPGEHMYVSLFPWPAGGAGVVWLDPRGGHTTSLVQTNIDPSGKLGAESILDSDVCGCCPTSSAMTDSGPLIMFRDRTTNNIRDMHVVSLLNGKWQPSHVVHADNWKVNGCPTNSGGLAARGREAVAVWFTGAGGLKRVSAAFSWDEGHTFREPLTIDDHQPSGRPALTLLQDGSAMITWLSSSPEGGDLKARQAWPDGRLGPTLSLTMVPPARKIGFPFVASTGQGAVAVWTDWEGERSHGLRSVLLIRSSKAEGFER